MVPGLAPFALVVGGAERRRPPSPSVLPFHRDVGAHLHLLVAPGGSSHRPAGRRASVSASWRRRAADGPRGSAHRGSRSRARAAADEASAQSSRNPSSTASIRSVLYTRPLILRRRPARTGRAARPGSSWMLFSPASSRTTHAHVEHLAPGGPCGCPPANSMLVRPRRPVSMVERVLRSGRCAGSGARSASGCERRHRRPPRRPKTTMSRSEFVPRRLRPMDAHACALARRVESRHQRLVRHRPRPARRRW